MALSRFVDLCVRMMTLLLALVAVPALALAQTHIQPRLVAESSMPAAGSKITLAIDMKTAKPWHGYWSNPGEAGFPLRLTWTVPKDVRVGAPAYPVPTTLKVADLMNYVFEGDHALLVDLTLSDKMAKGTVIPVKLDAEWLACTDEICVPEKGSYSITLTVGDGKRDGGAAIDAFRAKLPAPLGASATSALANGQLRLAIPFPAAASLEKPHFFPAASGLLVDAAEQRFSRSGDMLILSVPAPKDVTGRVEGVLALGNGRGLLVSADAGVVPPDGTPIGEAAKATGWSAILLAIGGAILGGLILNIMPCVFPIVSLKALSLARAGGDERAAKAEAMAYAAGVMVTCLALGALVLGLRAAGTQVGWAFQLQDPRIVLFLLLLATAITLNLAGVFELRAFGGGQGLAGQGGTMGAFWTGVLAAFVATPCTGPFMAAALGAALVLPLPAALGVFAGLGFGLALPFLAIGFVPALRRVMPKPGAWMATFQRILAIPMALTVVALLWLVYRQQGNIAGDWALVAVVVISVAAFGTGRRQRDAKSLGLAAVLGVMLATGWIMIKYDRMNENAAMADAGEAFSTEKLASLRASGEPVFVYFTADWCLTCKVNEKSAIDTRVAQDAFKAAGVTVLVGDWTNGDAKITRFLGEQGASGVPLYLYYPKGGGAAQQLPQILTPSLLAGLTQTN
jgi:thiol:disulfide interchange protein/DsbC/DsbD-like thiol-disulfide interchange protein